MPLGEGDLRMMKLKTTATVTVMAAFLAGTAAA